jgi:GntR family transcriptional regulator
MEFQIQPNQVSGFRLRKYKLDTETKTNINTTNHNKPSITPLNRQSRLPLHQQIYEVLRAKIQHEVWKPGELFPTEIDLMAEYQVSRATIRQVMERLVSEGLMYRQQGRGTFIAEPTLEEGLTRIISFTEDMHRRNLVAETKVLSEEIIPANEDVAKALQLQPGEDVAFIKRLRLANHEPMCIEESFLPYKLCPGLFEHDFSVEPLRETLETKYGIRIIRALQKIHAVAAPQDMVKLLNIPSHTALLFIERNSFNEWDRPVEFLRLYFRGDRYSLYNELRD